MRGRQQIDLKCVIRDRRASSLNVDVDFTSLGCIDARKAAAASAALRTVTHSFMV